MSFNFGHAADLKRHLKTVHEGVREHTRHICDKSFSQAGALKGSHKDCARRSKGTHMSYLWQNLKSS